MELKGINQNKDITNGEKNTSQELLMNNVVSHSLVLRKQNINKLLSSKRKLISKLNPFQNETSLNNNIINNNNIHPYLIQLNQLTIPQEIEIDIPKFLYEFNSDLLQSYFISSNINIQKYALYIFSQFIYFINQNTQYEEKIKSTSIETITSLCSYLSHMDNQIKYQAILLLINLTYYDNLQLKFSSVQSNLQQVFNFLLNNKKDGELIENALLLVKHILHKDVNNQLYFIDKKLLSIFEIISDIHKFNTNIQFNLFKCSFMFATGTFFAEYIDEYKKIIPIILPYIDKSYLNLNDESVIDTIRQATFALRNLTLRESLFDTITFYKIPSKAMTLYYYIEQCSIIDVTKQIFIQLNIIKIIGDLLCGDDILVQLLINENVIQFLNHVLLKNELQLLKNVYWCIDSISCGTLGQINELYKHGTLFKVIELCLGHYNEIVNLYPGECDNNRIMLLFDCFKGAIHAIAKAVIGSRFDNIITILHYQDAVIINLFCFGLVCFEEEYECNIKCLYNKYYKDKFEYYDEYILDIMKAINKIIAVNDIDVDMDSEENEINDNKSYISKLWQCDIKGKLEVLMRNANEKIASGAEELHNELIDDNY